MPAKQFDLEAFKAFVASKPAGEEYNRFHCDQCALGQFGFAAATICPEVAEKHFGVPAPVFCAAVHGPATWGALASRLAALETEAL